MEQGRSETTQRPAITALAPWFGSKRTLAPEIVRELGPHRAYWEPFCGSQAVLLAKPPASHETVNDLHGDLINLARAVEDALTGIIYRDDAQVADGPVRKVYGDRLGAIITVWSLREDT